MLTVTFTGTMRATGATALAMDCAAPTTAQAQESNPEKTLLFGQWGC